MTYSSWGSTQRTAVKNGSFADFSTRTNNNIGITFHFSPCNFDFSTTPGSGGCLPNGAGSLNTYYTLQLDSTSETSDSVTVYMDPTSSGTPAQPITIQLTINSAAASTTTTVTSSINPADIRSVGNLYRNRDQQRHSERRHSFLLKR